MTTEALAAEERGFLPFLPTLLARVSEGLRGGEHGDRVAPHDSAIDLDLSESVAVGSAFEVVPIPGKGHGCRATRDIRRGERLIAESPLFEQGPGQPPLNTAVERLSAADRKRFFSLTQNELRFGVIPSARGIFATNAHPCHEFNLLHRGIFPTIARFNHACDSNACYRWNSKLHQLTVHAAKAIPKGSEVTVCYSFDGMLRSQRQRHLSELFGFACGCAKCRLTGEELRVSDERLSAIGDVSAAVKELVHAGPYASEGSYLRSVAKADPQSLLSRLDAKWRMLKQEFPPDGYVDGCECFLQLHVELCERAVRKLLKLIASEEAKAAKTGEQSASSSTVDMLRCRAREYADAALHWATISLDLTRDIKGEDSPAFAAWASALDEGVFDLDGGGTFDFYSRWVRAGLARQSYCHRELG